MIGRNRKRNQFTLAWYDEDFPLVSQEFSKWVKRKSTRQQGIFRGLILGLAEGGLCQKSPIEKPIDRIERKLDELLKLIKQGVPVTQASEQVKAESQTSGNSLTDEDKARLNAILSEL